MASLFKPSPGFAKRSAKPSTGTTVTTRLEARSRATAASFPSAPLGSQRIYIPQGQHAQNAGSAVEPGRGPVPAAAKERASLGREVPRLHPAADWVSW
jgi:hypothetical protein